MMVKWIPGPVKAAWVRQKICKDPLNLLNKRLVSRRVKLGPDGMIWIDWAPPFFKGASGEADTKGEGKGRDPERWLPDRVKDRLAADAKKAARLARTAAARAAQAAQAAAAAAAQTA